MSLAAFGISAVPFGPHVVPDTHSMRNRFPSASRHSASPLLRRWLLFNPEFALLFERDGVVQLLEPVLSPLASYQDRHIEVQ
jgi:hypothetical protein